MARAVSTFEVFSCPLGKKLCHIALPGKEEKHRSLMFANEIGIGSLGNAVGASWRGGTARAWEIVLSPSEVRQAIRIRHSNVGSNQENQSPP
jgi:hypothetical protein